jgi:hypothetical protein
MTIKAKAMDPNRTMSEFAADMSHMLSPPAGPFHRLSESGDSGLTWASPMELGKC